jgi:ribosomal-protein-alanine N-acetyltransferase
MRRAIGLHPQLLLGLYPRKGLLTELRTNRLTLTPLTEADLQLYLDDVGRLEAALKLSLSRALLTDRVQRAIRMKLAKMAAIGDSLRPWYTYWLLTIPEFHFGAGLVGFKEYPDDRGEAEIGYGIDPAVQGQGYMTEAVRAMIGWAFQDPACHAVVARDTKKWNIASQRVLAEVGMSVYQGSDDAQWWRIDKTAE